jgi:hypothetical protein
MSSDLVKRLRDEATYREAGPIYSTERLREDEPHRLCSACGEMLEKEGTK